MQYALQVKERKVSFRALWAVEKNWCLSMYIRPCAVILAGHKRLSISRGSSRRAGRMQRCESDTILTSSILKSQTAEGPGPLRFGLGRHVA